MVRKVYAALERLRTRELCVQGLDPVTNFSFNCTGDFTPWGSVKNTMQKFSTPTGKNFNSDLRKIFLD